MFTAELLTAGCMCLQYDTACKACMPPQERCRSFGAHQRAFDTADIRVKDATVAMHTILDMTAEDKSVIQLELKTKRQNAQWNRAAEWIFSVATHAYTAGHLHQLGCHKDSMC